MPSSSAETVTEPGVDKRKDSRIDALVCGGEVERAPVDKHISGGRKSIVTRRPYLP